MKGYSLILLSVILFFSCGNSNTDKQKATIGKSIDTITNKKIKPDEAGRAKEWLLSNIKRFFKAQALKDDTLMFTKRYLEYKHDAIGREYDGMTEKEFENKWQDIYNTKLANNGSILIGQQDWINPKVAHCELKNKTADKGFIFNVIIEDADTQEKYTHTRDIKVIPISNTFIIDEILEYDN